MTNKFDPDRDIVAPQEVDNLWLYYVAAMADNKWLSLKQAVQLLNIFVAEVHRLRLGLGVVDLTKLAQDHRAGIRWEPYDLRNASSDAEMQKAISWLRRVLNDANGKTSITPEEVMKGADISNDDASLFMAAVHEADFASRVREDRGERLFKGVLGIETKERILIELPSGEVLARFKKGDEKLLKGMGALPSQLQAVIERKN